MKWVEVFLMKGNIDAVVTRFHEERILEVRSSERLFSGSKRIDGMVRIDGRIVTVLDFLGSHEVNDARGLRAIIPRVPDRMEVKFGGGLLEAEKWVKGVEREINPMIRSLRSIEEEIAFITELREKLLKLSGLGISLGRIGSLERTRIRIGLSRAYPELKSVMENAGGWVESSLLSKKEGLHAVRLIYPRSMDARISSELRGVLFSEMTIDIPRLRSVLIDNGYPSSGVDSSILDLLGLLDELEGTIQERDDAVNERAAAVSMRELGKARSWEEAISIEVDKLKLSMGLYSTNYTNMISGWVEKNRISHLKGILNSTVGPDHEITIRDPTLEEVEKGDVPTSLNNGWLGKVFEPLTLTFSPPKYNEIDPTIWFSIPFILFFGLMLGDAGYGLLILAGSFAMYRLGRSDPSIRNMGIIGMMMGAASLITGIWMGSLFGDLVPRVLLGNEAGLLYGPYEIPLLGTVPYDTLRDPMRLFSISLYLGLAQLNIGLILLGIDRLKKGSPWGFIKGTVSWMFVQVGAIILVGGFMLGWYELTTTLTYIGLALFLAGAGLLVFEVGAMFMFDIEGYLGDWLSYSRILALGLSTFGLAMAFNIVGVMLIDITPFLIPVVLILLIFLHIFNLLLQTLGSSVHALRLQYVEFFGRFYEGGGILFKPFGRERTYTLVGEARSEGGGR